MQNYFIAIQGTYSSLEICLFKNSSCITTLLNTELRASSHLIPLFSQVLAEHSLTLNDIDFIGIDKGPGAFTSLRAVIATLNGIAFASGKPLVPISSLLALNEEGEEQKKRFPHAKLPFTASILNAYNNEAYYRIKSSQPNQPIKEGCAPILEVIEFLNTFQEGGILNGNGTQTYKDQISQSLNKNWVIQNSCSFVPSAKTIGRLAHLEWTTTKFSTTVVQPYYLKTTYFGIKP